jgi:HlyD family secretion protein
MSKGSDPALAPGAVPSRRPKKTRLWVLVLVLLLTAAAGVAAVLLPKAPAPAKADGLPAVPRENMSVGSRGRIEPEDGILLVAAPYFSGRPSLIKELRVKEGDWVKSGQVLAVLDGWDSAEKTLHETEADVEVARTRLAQIRAAPKQADVEEQKIEIARWESEYEIASNEYRRYQKLFREQIAPENDLDQKLLGMERAKRMLEAARERLKSIEEIRKVDVDVRSAELAAAMTKVAHARVDVQRMLVQAPADGRVLKIHNYAGEEAGSEGILELGRTRRMYVVAEVYETDIARVRVGQKADISGDLVPEGLTGTVVQIGPQVSMSQLLSPDPLAFADTRVVKVKIELQNGERVAGLIYGKVNVVIHP